VWAQKRTEGTAIQDTQSADKTAALQMDHVRQRWAEALVVEALGRAPNLPSVSEELQRLT
jgi:hypothetical protein